MFCDCKIPTELKGKFYHTIIRLAMLYGMDSWDTKKQHMSSMSVAEIRILRWMYGKTLEDRIRNENIRRMIEVTPIEDMREKDRLR